MQLEHPVRLRRSPALILSLALAGAVMAQDPLPQAPTFDAGADAVAAIEAARDLAAHKNRRVLVLWGTNGDSASETLAAALRGRELSRFLLYEYCVVKVSVGADDAVRALARTHGTDLAAGVPHLTVLDAKGARLASAPGSTWIRDAVVDAATLKGFLEEQQAEPQDAEKVLAGALARAKAEDKRLIVHLGAPW